LEIITTTETQPDEKNEDIIQGNVTDGEDKEEEEDSRDDY